MFPTLQIGPLSLQVPGLLLLAGLWIGLNLSERQAAHSRVKPDLVYNLAFTVLIAGVVGARLVYILRYPQAFLPSPLSILSLNPGLLDTSGGVVIGILGGLVYGQRKGLPLWPTLDALAPGLAALAVAIGLAHLASGAAFGAPTGLPWGIELWGARRHPYQIYETLAAALILVAVWPGRGFAATWFHHLPGMRFLAFLVLSAAARLFLEAFRGDSQLLAGGIRVAQAGAWALLAASLWGLWQVLKQIPGEKSEGTSRRSEDEAVPH